jgi:hypothetical protein
MKTHQPWCVSLLAWDEPHACDCTVVRSGYTPGTLDGIDDPDTPAARQWKTDRREGDQSFSFTNI